MRAEPFVRRRRGRTLLEWEDGFEMEIGAVVGKGWL